MKLTSLALLLVAAIPAAAVQNSPVDCQERFHTEYGYGAQTYYAQETHTIARNSISVLSLHPSHNGGVAVEGWDQPDIEVTACKSSDEQSRLSQIRVVIHGGDVTSEGPQESGWTIHFLVRVPNGINLKAEAQNGPLSFRRVNGTVEAHTQNGPISLKDCTGTINADAHNGPISVAGTSGKVKAEAQNGPVTIRLSDSEWKGEGLDASTHNGPISLRVPANYRSGVEVTSTGRSPFSCAVCKSEQRTWEDDGTKRVHFGTPGAPVVVRLSTTNGPVSIRDTFE
jgi:hypothetical protein